MIEIEDNKKLADIKSVNKSQFPQCRLRRLRQHPMLRELVQEHRLSASDLVLPLFIKAGKNVRQPIAALPGHCQLSPDNLQQEIADIVQLNIPAVLLFGIPEYKDAQGSSAWQDDGVIQQAIRAIKSQSINMLVMVDLCCCEYTDHGHCGVLRGREIDNDQTLELLQRQAVSLAAAGADVIAPSGMMDGAVASIRQALDHAGFNHVVILSYAVKFASAFYGPFRQAAEYTLAFGDRRSHQLDPANAAQALREAALDANEGADMLMVKPAMHYLDVIYRVKQQFPSIPLGAYHVSGEYAMLQAAAAKGWLDEAQAVYESLLSIKRAGADFIITYYAKIMARTLQR